VRRQLTEAQQVLSQLEKSEVLPRHLSLCAEEYDYVSYSIAAGLKRWPLICNKLLGHLRGVCESYLSRLENWKVEHRMKFRWPSDTISWFPILG
jgi:hypothetical protein